jgi:hypothetical protein
LAKPVRSADKSSAKPLSVKQTLYNIWDKTGVMPIELLNHDPLPPHFPHLWEWFFEFAQDITWSEINAWDNIAKVGITRWEGALLIQMDYLRKTHE